MVDWIGKTLGKVRIELLLARGGMAEVYLGMHTTLQRPVAVKLLHTQYLDDSDLFDRFQREARAVARLRHPNIVQVLDFDVFRHQPYLVMEYVPGVTLSAFLRDLHHRGERLDWGTVSALLDMLASALEYAHESGVIHRDVKPGNIMLTSRVSPVERDKPLPLDVQPVLMDFGLVRLLRTDPSTTTGAVAGTPAYMSPEQARGDKTDARTDVYSLGIVLYEMLAGRPPFAADTSMGLLMKQISEPPEPVAGLPPQLQAVLDRVLAKQPRDRFQTPMDLARAFASALQAHSKGLTLPPSRPVSLLGPSERGRARHRLSLPVLLGIAAAFVIGGLLLFNTGSGIPISGTVPGSHAAPTPGGERAIAALPTTSVDYEIAAVLRFQNGSAIADRATLTAMHLPPAPAGYQYEVWLLGDLGESRRSIGRLVLDTEGQGALSFVDAQGQNLVERYDTLQITVEPDPDPNPNPTGDVAYQAGLPQAGLVHVRHLLVSFDGAPNRTALAQGLLYAATTMDQIAHEMWAQYEAGDPAGTMKNAELMLNLLVGSQSTDHKDWDHDGTVGDPGDGFGLLLNGDHAGYIEGTFSHASFAATSDHATQNMIVHGVHVEVCAQNLEQWAPLLRDLLMQVLTSSAGPEAEPILRQAVTLSDQFLNGADLNGNELVEPIPGEGGASTANQHAYYMSDITIYAQQK